jgi:hypothetical protein
MAEDVEIVFGRENIVGRLRSCSVGHDGLDSQRVVSSSNGRALVGLLDSATRKGCGRFPGGVRSRCELFVDASAESFVYRAGGGVAHAGEDVRICVEGYGYGRVSEKFLDVFGVYSL